MKKSFEALWMGAFAMTAALTPGLARAAETARFTAETPDAMIDAALARGIAKDATDADVLAAIATTLKLADRATEGRARAALEKLGATNRGGATDAKLLARALSADEGDASGIAADEALGVVTNLAVLGPFRDTGGGLDRKDGPEATGAFADPKASYAWGTVDVHWRAVPRAAASASGVPSDLLISPRRESCSIFATALSLPADKNVIVSLASSGQVALSFDGAVVGKSEDVFRSAFFDRIAARVAAKKGDHLVAAKICTGALDDEGRVRLRITDDAGASLASLTKTALVDVPAKNTSHGTPQITALSRALASNAKDVSTLLDVAILRTLGGADDLRSPRVGGQLDRLTQDAKASPDVLAMAGWIAPSGANRSGWLDRAREKAHAAGDARTEAFALRRLVAERASSGMGDYAYASWNAARGNATDDEATILDALTLEAIGSDLARAQAREKMFAAFSKSPSTVPLALLTELLRAAKGRDATMTVAIATELQKRGYGGLDIVTAVKTRGAAEVSKAAKHAFESASISDQDEAMSVVDAVVDAGDHPTALALATALVELAPNQDGAWSRLSDELAIGGGAPNVNAAVLEALARARSLAPGEARYRALAKLRSKTESRSEFHDDEKYLAPIETILARRQGVPDGAPDCADRELHWLRAVTFHPDGRISQLIHYAREIVIAPRTESELLEELPIEGDLSEILRARVHRKGGGIAYPTEEHNEGTRPRVHWPDLFPGDTVEIVIRSWTSQAIGGRGDAPFYFLDYAGATTTHPLLYNEVVIDTPKDKPLYVDVIHQKPDGVKIERHEENGRIVQRYVWEKPESIAEEPLAPNLSEIVPVIVGSTFKSWKDFRAWYSEAVKGFTEPDDQVIRLAKELTKGKVTREQKLSALFNFVADDIRYVNYVSGEWWLPNRPQQLLARREGDCDDKALLLITLLKSVGIEAEEVMVQTRLTAQPSVVLAKNVAVPMFDHGIAFLPGPNGGTYLDATSPESRLGPLPSMDAHAVALRLNSTDDIVELPASRPEDHGSEVKWKITLSPEGNADLEGDELHTGDGAFFLRTYLRQADARGQYVENNLLSGFFPTLELDKQIDFDPDLKNGEARVRYKAKSEGYARKEKDDLVVPLSGSQPLAAQLAPLPKRTLPIELPSYMAPSHLARTMTFVAPPGFRVGTFPQGGVVDGGEFGKGSLDVTIEGKNKVIVKVTRVLAQHRIPVEKYAAFRRFLTSYDALMHKTVRFVPEEK